MDVAMESDSFQWVVEATQKSGGGNVVDETAN